MTEPTARRLPPSEYDDSPLCPRCGANPQGVKFVGHGGVASDNKTYSCKESCQRYNFSDQLCGECERAFLHDQSSTLGGPVPGAEFDPHWLLPCWESFYGDKRTYGVGELGRDHDSRTGVSRTTCGNCAAYVEYKDGVVIDRSHTYERQIAEGEA